MALEDKKSAPRLSSEGENQSIVFYDGDCGLCHGGMHFFAKIDRHDRLRFAPIGGEAFAEIEADSDRLPDSILFVPEPGCILVRSEAIAEMLKTVGGVWGFGGRVINCIPRSFTDWVYDLVATYRRRFFGRPEGSCPLVSQELRRKFID